MQSANRTNNARESAADKALEYAELNKARAFSNSWGHAFVDGLKHQVPVALQDRETTIANERDALQSELAASNDGSGEPVGKSG